MPWWQAKDRIRSYLEEVNSNEKAIYLSVRNFGIAIDVHQILEYCLFQPGLFLNYLAAPYTTAKHFEPLNTMIDFQNRRAIAVEGHDTIMTFTTVQDLARVVVEAVDLECEWPIVGGIRGNRMRVSDIIKVGERVRGKGTTFHNSQKEISVF